MKTRLVQSTHKTASITTNSLANTQLSDRPERTEVESWEPIDALIVKSKQQLSVFCR
jgi:hypothetical protein